MSHNSASQDSTNPAESNVGAEFGNDDLSSSSASSTPITFECPYCQLSTSVGPEYQGKTGPCAGCGRTITVPSGAADEPESKRQPRSHKSLPNWLRAALAFSAVVVLLTLLIGAGRWFFGPAFANARTKAAVVHCSNNLQQIISAIHAYRAERGELPPQYIVDESGRPLHSWRVLILPYLGAEAAAAYSRIDLSQPWNSPANRTASAWMPDVYRCRSDKAFSPTDTSYLAVTGKGFAFNGTKETKLEDATDALSDIILVVESANSNINWMEPRDLPRGMLIQGVGSRSSASCCSHHQDATVNAAFADGSVRDIGFMSGNQLVDMATTSGGEPAGPIKAP